ncbi:hypothetical protein MTQ13_00540 [Streptomyces sp. XM4011]|uniref:hypothetical protein n=1 Tax=Streptomyces sp. XM4011 TaxID=2929780 RepID=UPI001FF9A774|nr:hypothetical protein [Streptomyces sp. XM4011]MCK1812779.1 hypothetical protein [Streptomyces sp. XM4011]
MPPNHMSAPNRARHEISIPQPRKAETQAASGLLARDTVVHAQLGAAFIAVLVLPVVLFSSDPVTPEVAAMAAAMAAATRLRVQYQRVRLA